MADQASDRGPLPPSRPFLIGLVLVLVALALWVTWPYLGAVVLALLTGFLLQPVHRRLSKLVRWPSLSAAILLLAVGLLLVAPFVIVLWQVYDDMTHFIDFLQDPAAVQARVESVAKAVGIPPQDVARYAQQAGEWLAVEAAQRILPALRLVIEFLIALVLYFFLLFFAIRDGSKWVVKLRHYIPLPPKDKDALLAGAAESIWAITMGTFFVAAIQGIVAAFGWWIFGFPAPIFWGTIMVIIGLLPVGAPFFVTVPASIIAIIQGDLVAGIGLFVYTIVVVGLTDDLLRPVVVGRASGIHPALILIGMLGGLAVFGIAGFLLGPFVFALLGPVLDVWAKRRRAHFDDGDAPDEATEAQSS